MAAQRGARQRYRSSACLSCRTSPGVTEAWALIEDFRDIDELVSRASGLRLELPASESARRAFAAAGVPLESDAVTTPEGETDLDHWLDSVPPELADNAV